MKIFWIFPMPPGSLEIDKKLEISRFGPFWNKVERITNRMKHFATPLTIFVVTLGGQTCIFWWKIHAFCHFFTIEHVFVWISEFRYFLNRGSKALILLRIFLKYQFSAILGFWNIPNTQKLAFEIKLYTLLTKWSAL